MKRVYILMLILYTLNVSAQNNGAFEVLMSDLQYEHDENQQYSDTTMLDTFIVSWRIINSEEHDTLRMHYGEYLAKFLLTPTQIVELNSSGQCCYTSELNNAISWRQLLLKCMFRNKLLVGENNLSMNLVWEATDSEDERTECSVLKGFAEVPIYVTKINVEECSLLNNINPESININLEVESLLPTGPSGRGRKLNMKLFKLD